MKDRLFGSRRLRRAVRVAIALALLGALALPQVVFAGPGWGGP